MRNLNANALAKIATTHGNEPITIVEIDWIIDGGSSLYADRTIGGIQGKITNLGALDNVINVSENDQSQEISVTLDDTDGTIKEILDSHDIHKRDARVYQYFDGMDIDDRFLLFAGKISSPITWSARERNVSFTIISQLEDLEVGFSAEEGQFPWIPKDLIDQAWPMIFGKVIDVPAMQFNQAVKGTTLCGVGIISGQDAHMNVPYGGNDSAYQVQRAQLNAQIQHTLNCHSALCGGEKYGDQKEGYGEQAESMIDQRNESDTAHWKSKKCAQLKRAMTLQDAISEHGEGGLGCNPIRILGGEDFPQDIGLKIQIGQGIFSGYFEEDNFHISDRVHENDEEDIERQVESQSSLRGNTWNSNLYALQRRVAAYQTYLRGVNFRSPIGEDFGDPGEDWDALCAPFPPVAAWDIETKLPCVSGGWPRTIKSAGIAIGTVSDDETSEFPAQIARHYWADAGSSVSIVSNEPITYAVSIIPGTVLAVKAYKNFENERKLINVPTDSYSVAITDYGTIQAIEITIDKPLSTITGQGWEDDIYVTFESDVGPHTCDILQYIIDNYTDLTYHTASFTGVRSYLDPFPMNFPILEKKNAITVLQEIAFQARCALWIANGKFFIKYLPKEPGTDDTITESDIDAESGIEVEMTATEDLVTRMNVEWRINWNEDDPNKVILRHNIKKYGTQQEDFFFYCFNQPDIVLKAATFWLIRKANTWKRIKFKTYLNKLNLESFDTVKLSFGSDYVSTGDVKAVVEESSYNSDDKSIDIVCLVPIRSGEMTLYDGFWPSQLSTDHEFPTPEEKEAGNAGGDGIGQEATGDLPVRWDNPNNPGSGVVWVGGPNVVFTGPADQGEKRITDIDFIAQTVVLESTYAELTNIQNPDPNLNLNYRLATLLPDIPETRDFPHINLHETLVVDTTGDDTKVSTLSTFFKTINEDVTDAKLIVDCDESLWGDAEQREGKEFHFKYDEDGEKFGAGTAWLKDE